MIDIQNFYFSGGQNPLEQPEEASRKAQKILDMFRKRHLLVVHVRHNAKSGAGIHERVAPANGEKVITKDHVNAFKDTNLLEFLRSRKIKNLVICGMMTHMCVEAAVRAASDFNFKCVLIGDACATRALKYGDVEVDARAVHLSTLSTLDRYYAEVMNTDEFLQKMNSGHIH
ncbi:MAG: cysteine hydrolase family protein [Candidatus Aminicenantales bacterium]